MVMKMTRQEQREEFKSVYLALQERGYNPLAQLTGYLLSEDPTYITNHKGARSRIAKLDRDRLLSDMVSSFFE